MWLAPMARWLVLTASAFPTGADLSTAEDALPEPIATRQTVFAIPFRVDRPADTSRGPVEVQLWVSADRGRNWQLYGKVEPKQGQFLFRATADGEYWFLVRTLNGSGEVRPGQSGSPEMRVIVDTMLPKLQLTAEQGQAGQVTARWTIDEPYPKPESLTIQYRTTPNGPWQPVAVGRRELSASGLRQTGEVTWWPQAASSEIQVRAEVSDLAGNLAVSHARVERRQAARPVPSAPGVDTTSPWRAGTPDAPPTAWPADHSTDSPLRPDALGRQQPDSQYPDHSTYPDGYADGTSRYADGTGTPDPYRNDLYPANADPYGTAGGYRSPYPSESEPTAGGGSFTADPPDVSVRSWVNPPIRNQYVSPEEPNTASASSGWPPGERPRWVNSRLFELEYEIESVGPSGIARVELFGTRDGGRIWKSYALDNDNRSPLLVTVDDEGTYGFRLAVANGAGLGGSPPQTGELPDIVIGVDWTKPSARILSIDQGTGPQSGSLIISWQADDKMLAARPVSLYFSESPRGPWTTIASGLENSGRYAWPIGYRLPERIYLRLEVRDEAGNVGVFETAEFVSPDRTRPSVRIRDVRPLGQSTGGPTTRSYFH